MYLLVTGMQESSVLDHPAVTNPLYKHLSPRSMLTMMKLNTSFRGDSALMSEYMSRVQSFEICRQQILAFLCNLLYGLLLTFPPPPQNVKVSFAFPADIEFTFVRVTFTPNTVQFTHKSSGLTQYFNPRTQSRVDLRNNLLGFLYTYIDIVSTKVFTKNGKLVGLSLISQTPFTKRFVDGLRAATMLHKPFLKITKRSSTEHVFTINFNFSTPRSDVPPPYEPPKPPSPPNALQRDSAVRSAINSTPLIGTAESQSLLSRGSLTKRTNRMRDETIARIASLRLR